MSRTKDAANTKVEALMEKASRALGERRYFESEAYCVEAMDLAHQVGNYGLMARICLPLQECRRQKRDMAADARRVFVIDDQLPKPGKLQPGCYLVRPPRVGLDGRLLREMADRREVPVIVVVREPTTRTGLWPLVSLGPVTVRVRVEPPQRTAPPARRAGGGPRKKAPAPQVVPGQVEDILPTVEWFLSAGEQLGDAAIATVDAGKPADVRADELLLRLGAQPDHEKLHQALADACLQASREEPSARRARAEAEDDELEAEEDTGDDTHEAANAGL